MAKVTIVGAGFIGRAWAISFARAGHQVVLWDENPAAPEAAVEFARTVLPDLAENDLLAGKDSAAVLSLIGIERDLGAAVAGADDGHLSHARPQFVACPGPWPTALSVNPLPPARRSFRK